MDSPIKKACAVAEVIHNDPVMAGQIREYIPVRELLDLLGITVNEVLYATPAPEDDGDLPA
jgi:hypothetical protein